MRPPKRARHPVGERASDISRRCRNPQRQTGTHTRYVGTHWVWCRPTTKWQKRALPVSGLAATQPPSMTREVKSESQSKHQNTWHKDHGKGAVYTPHPVKQAKEEIVKYSSVASRGNIPEGTLGKEKFVNSFLPISLSEKSQKL